MNGVRTAYAVAAVGWAAFVAVGSLVPFDFESRSWSDAVETFTRVVTTRPTTISKSDTLTNLLLGVPLGFALLGAVFAGRWASTASVLAVGVLLLPVCAAFSSAVEFAQLFAPGRVCSGVDVLAQVVGAAAGMVAWLLFGRWFTAQAVAAATGTEPASRLLVAYVFLLGLMQALPLDFNSSPADAYRKFRDGEVKPIPFAEFRTLTADGQAKAVADLVQLALLYAPVGLLAACVPGRFWGRRNVVGVLLAALALALAMELGQVLVRSRTCKGTDVVLGGLAAFAGWAVGHGFRRGLKSGRIMLLGAVWGGALLWVSWWPLRTGGAPAFDWTPGMPLQGRNPLWTLEALLAKLVLFGLAGALVAARPGVARPPAFATPLVLGLATSAVCEAGQTYFAGHTPGITDVILGGLGALCGAWVATRVRARIAS